MTTLDELFVAFAGYCGVESPRITREELDADFHDWCAEVGVPADYASQAAAYLAALEAEGMRWPRAWVVGPD
jgi:hypothetical protein